MRGKKAKMLRKMARNASTGLPERKLLGKDRSHTVIDAKSVTRHFRRIQAINDPKSTRGIYRFLKRQAGAFRPGNKAEGVQHNG